MMIILACTNYILNRMTQDYLYDDNVADHTEGLSLLFNFGALIVHQKVLPFRANLLCRHFFELLLQIRCAPILHLYVTCIQLKYLNNLTGTHLFVLYI